MIDTIFNLGDDALQNEYNVIFDVSAVDGLGELPVNFQFRISNFTPPDITMGTYQYFKKGSLIVKPNGLDETPKTFTFNMRVDKYWESYKVLDKWLKIIKNEKKGTRTVDKDIITGEQPVRGIITIQALDSNDSINYYWKFEGSFPTALAGVTFDEATGEPITINPTFTYLTMFTPANEELA